VCVGCALSIPICRQVMLSAGRHSTCWRLSGLGYNVDISLSVVIAIVCDKSCIEIHKSFVPLFAMSI